MAKKVQSEYVFNLHFKRFMKRTVFSHLPEKNPTDGDLVWYDGGPAYLPVPGPKGSWGLRNVIIAIGFARDVFCVPT